jgi:hypothetical protein
MNIAKLPAGLVFLLPALLVGCRCPVPDTQLTQGELAFSFEDPGGVTLIAEDGTYDFGQVYLGETKKLKLRVQNTGNGTLKLLELTKLEGAAVEVLPNLIEPSPVFEVAYAQGDLTRGSTQEFDITFTPPLELDPAVTSRDHQVILNLALANAQKSSATITLKGVGVSGKCELPRELDFGAVARGDSVGREVVFSNAGPLNSTAYVGRISSNSGDDTAFSFVSNASQGDLTIAPGESRTATVNFSPTEIKDYQALVELRASDGCPHIMVRLVGTGVDSVLTWDPSPLDFGYVTPTLSASAELTFSNFSITPVTLSSLAPLSSEYIVNLPPAATVVVPAATRDEARQLRPGTAPVQITFKPTLPGPRNDQLNFSTTLARQPTGAAQLRGYGGGPKIDVKPSPILNAGRLAYQTGANLFTKRKLTVQNVGSYPTPPDVRANLHLGQPGNGKLWDVALPSSAAGANSALDEICVGEWDATNGTCLGTLPASYNPAIGVEAQGARSLVDIGLRLMPKSLGLKEWEITIYSDDQTVPAYKVTVRAEAKTYPPCAYQVTPTVLNFGLVTPPAYRDLAFSIANLGTAATDICLVSNLDIKQGSDQTFSLPAGATSDEELMPGEVLTVVARAWPQGVLPTTLTAVTGAANFQINSPTAPDRDVTLNAAIAQSCLTISPADLDFGTVQKDCNSATRSFSIYNTCASNVVVNSFSMVVPAGEPAGGPNCPGTSQCAEFIAVNTAGIGAGTTIAPNAAPTSFSLKYKPINYGPDTGAFVLNVTQNGTAVDYVITLRGRGDAAGLNTNVFIQDANPKADILLIVDDSCSMSDKQQALATNFSAFIAYAERANVDYQIGVTTTDQWSNTRKGRLIGNASNPKILKRSTSNVQSLFQAKVNVGIMGSPDEQSASVAVSALTAPLITAENAGLIRPDASLAVVTVTDAEDQSPLPAAHYISQFLNIKGAQRSSLFSYSGVIPTYPSLPPNCTYDNASAGNDPMHGQMIMGGGGIQEEICNPDWAVALEQIGMRAFGFRTNFNLLSTPDTGQPIVVTVDGITIASTNSGGATVWTYEPMTNSVRFEPLYVPEAGKTLAVTYHVQCIP